jgi:hypothetical protein
VLPFGPILDLLRGYSNVHPAEKLQSLARELLERLSAADVSASQMEPAQEKKRYFQVLDDLFSGNTSGLLLIVEFALHEHGY